ncbi:MAG: hypothetical protein IJ142_00075 [Bacteroidaceae bacterium]|nr:hypothetical protein [Bacteroidaceae bacterium]
MKHLGLFSIIVASLLLVSCGGFYGSMPYGYNPFAGSSNAGYPAARYIGLPANLRPENAAAASIKRFENWSRNQPQVTTPTVVVPTYPTVTTPVTTSSSPGSSTSSTSNGNSSSSTSCNFCHGIGKCWTCNGTRRVSNGLGVSGYHTCTSCSDGLCRHCHGTGKK